MPDLRTRRAGAVATTASITATSTSAAKSAATSTATSTATSASASATAHADHVAPTATKAVERPPLALTAKSAVTIKDLMLKDPDIGARIDRKAKTWEPDVVLLILSRFHAQPGVADLSANELARQIELGMHLPDDVVAGAAKFMGYKPDALRTWLSQRPWTQMGNVAPLPARDVAETQKQVAAWVRIADASYRPAPVDVDHELRRTRLKPDAISLMHHWAKEIVGADAFLAQHERSETADARDGQAGFTLGATGPNNFAVLRFATATNLRFWQDGYFRLLNGSSRDQRTTSYAPQTNNYMDLITASGEPVVFLLPPDIGRNRYPVTAHELKWLLNHPERMRNVTFVLGAYQ